MRVEKFIDSLQSDGRFAFTLKEAEQFLGNTRAAILSALYRLKKNKRIVSPANEFYLILTPQYDAYGCLPADMFIDDLMKHLNLPYYVSFLSAAQFYGAAHQKPQYFQVVTSSHRRSIQIGRIRIQFIVSKNIAAMPIKLFNTYTGTLKVATPEIIALDIISSPKYAAGLNNCATILLELAAKINPNKLIELISINPELAWIQRLGYLFEYLGFQKLSNILETPLKNKKLYWTKLIPSASLSIKERNKKWKVIVNTNIEPDEV